MDNTKFTQPTCLNKLSLAHRFNRLIPTAIKPDRISNYLLLSEKDAVTQWHIDFSMTSVMYFLMCGAKEFVVVPSNPTNRSVFETYTDLPNK